MPPVILDNISRLTRPRDLIEMIVIDWNAWLLDYMKLYKIEVISIVSS